MILLVILALLLYLIAGIGFAKLWSEAANSDEVEMKITCCIFWPVGLFISAFWSW
ncbi:hypothetical protein [Raoultella ornithinolytica]|uniref:hypothetical protein n=1 Tax=Raoultella ornithinolytica TaxID=54291 RepID=UPI0013C34A71|nr:hypothetical protein [Raoultella ornithinolytica]